MSNWYNFLVNIKPDGKAFRSILNTKILLEVIDFGIKLVQDYAIFTINDQVWYTNDNFDPEPWEERYGITVPEFSTIEERRQVVKSYMLFPQYQNRLSLDYFQLSLNNAGYDTITVLYNDESGASNSNVRMNTVLLSQGDDVEVIIPQSGYSDTNYEFSFQAYDSNGYEIFPILKSKTSKGIFFDMPQEGIVTISTLIPDVGDSLRMVTESLSAGNNQTINIPYGGYVDDNYDFHFQAYDSNGHYVPIIYKSKINTGVTFDIPQDAIVTLSTSKAVVDDALRFKTESVSKGQVEITIPDDGYIDNLYNLEYQAYDSNGYEIFPVLVSKTSTTVILNMPQNGIVSIKTFKITTEGQEDSFMHANDFADEKAEFNLGPLTFNSFIVTGEIQESLYKNVIYLLMSLKPPQVVLYDKIEVLQAIALDDNLAIALDDNLAIALETL
jgi:hypothetical protein